MCPGVTNRKLVRLVDMKKMLSQLATPEGFEVFRKLMTRKDYVYDTLVNSGLENRGMRGGEFSEKLRTTSDYAGVVVNTAECFWGQKKEAAIVWQAPENVVEGALLVALAVKARYVCIVVHGALIAHYQKLVQIRDQAIERGVIGPASPLKILVHIRLSGGFLGGAEDEAVLRHLESDQVHNPAPSTLYGEKVLMGAAETFLCVPTICVNGADWWKKNARQIVAISGEVVNPQVVEVAVGEGLVAAVEKYAGGVRGVWSNVRCVFPGGLLSKPLVVTVAEKAVLCESAMQKLNTTIRSGDILIVSKSSDLLRMVQMFMDFVVEERSGYCVGCREGLPAVQNALYGGDVGAAVYAARMARDVCICQYSKWVTKGLLGLSEIDLL